MTPSRADFLSRLRYCPHTGVFVWLPSPTQSKGWNGKWANRPAGNLSDGYLRIGIFGRRYKAHTIAWVLMTGAWPDREIDHINRIRDDNRWCNLRLATDQQNACNRSIRSDNTTGFAGITVRPGTGKYQAVVTHLGRSHYLGVFDSKEDAVAARDQAATRLHGDFARIQSEEKAA